MLKRETITMMNHGISEISYLETLWGGPVGIGLGLTYQGGGGSPTLPPPTPGGGISNWESG